MRNGPSFYTTSPNNVRVIEVVVAFSVSSPTGVRKDHEDWPQWPGHLVLVLANCGMTALLISAVGFTSPSL